MHLLQWFKTIKVKADLYEVIEREDQNKLLTIYLLICTQKTVLEEHSLNFSNDYLWIGRLRNTFLYIGTFSVLLNFYITVV